MLQLHAHASQWHIACNTNLATHHAQCGQVFWLQQCSRRNAQGGVEAADEGKVGWGQDGVVGIRLQRDARCLNGDEAAGSSSSSSSKQQQQQAAAAAAAVKHCNSS
jgi:hypothetical protein